MPSRRTARALVLGLATSALVAGTATAADQTILGTSIQLKSPPAVTGRKVVVKAKEKASPNTLVGNPVLTGAALTVQVSGGTPSAQTFSLPTGTSPLTGKPFWSGDATAGFKYKDGKGENGPLKALKIKRSGSGTFSIKAVATSRFAPITVLPANPGTSSCAALNIPGGDVYHVLFGTGDGVITNVGAVTYKHKKPLLQGLCPGISTTTTTTTSTTTTTLANCTNLVRDGLETDVDCGGGVCPRCLPGDGCLVNTDCNSSVCGAFICQAPSCTDGVKNGSETDVDCGGGACPDCALGDACLVNGDCLSNTCAGAQCRCPNTLFTFTVNSNAGGVFDSAEWPGGAQIQSTSAECAVSIQNPDTNIDLVCTLGSPFAVTGVSGFSSCFGSGGEDGDGCQPVSCPPAGVGSCCSGRPSCSAALNGAGSARYFVQCLQ